MLKPSSGAGWTSWGWGGGDLTWAEVGGAIAPASAIVVAKDAAKGKSLRSQRDLVIVFNLLKAQMYEKFVYYNQYSTDFLEGQFIKVMNYVHKSHIWNVLLQEVRSVAPQNIRL